MTSSRYLAGNILIFGSILGSAFYNTYSKHLLQRFSDLEVLLYSYYAVLLVLIPVTIAAEPSSVANIGDFTLRTWIGLAILALFQYFLSMVLFLNVLTRLDATQAALPNYLIPFFGVLLAALLLHERLTWFMVIGGMLVLLSTVIATIFETAAPDTPGTARPAVPPG